MYKKGQTREITFGGALMLVIAGVLFLSASSTDTTGIVGLIGIVFLLGGIIAAVAFLIKFFSR